MVKNDNARKIWTVCKCLLLVGIVFSVPVYLIFFRRDILTEFESLEDMIQFLQGYQTHSILIYVLFQAVQIVISILPGQPLQIAAGILWGYAFALGLSILGAFLGTTVSFFLARILGQDAAKLFVSADKMERYVKLLDSRRAITVVFLIYLIPGLPKDIMSYIAGISSMHYKRFLLASLVGRIPAMSCSILVGVFYYQGNTAGLATVVVGVVLITALCIWKRKRLLALLDRFYDTLSVEA